MRGVRSTAQAKTGKGGKSNGTAWNQDGTDEAHQAKERQEIVGVGPREVADFISLTISSPALITYGGLGARLPQLCGERHGWELLEGAKGLRWSLALLRFAGGGRARSSVAPA